MLGIRIQKFIQKYTYFLHFRYKKFSHWRSSFPPVSRKQCCAQNTAHMMWTTNTGHSLETQRSALTLSTTMDLTGSWPFSQCSRLTHRSSRKACSWPHMKTHCLPASTSSNIRSPEQLSCETQSGWAASRQQKCPNNGSWWVRFSEIIYTRAKKNYAR